MREIKFEYGFQSVNGIVKKTYHLHELPDIKEKCDVWNILPIAYVRQFTGLYDKDGREIYEGDVVECLSATEPEDKGFLCVFKDFRWKFFNIRYPDNDFYSTVNYFYIQKKCVVIGNIHEHPELLNEQK